MASLPVFLPFLHRSFPLRVRRGWQRLTEGYETTLRQWDGALPQGVDENAQNSGLISKPTIFSLGASISIASCDIFN